MTRDARNPMNSLISSGGIIVNLLHTNIWELPSGIVWPLTANWWEDGERRGSAAVTGKEEFGYQLSKYQRTAWHA